MEILKCKVIMLPTDDNGLLIYQGTINQSLSYVDKDGTNHPLHQGHYIYFISNREIMDGDRFYNVDTNTIQMFENEEVDFKPLSGEFHFKVEATNDPSLYEREYFDYDEDQDKIISDGFWSELPRIPRAFVQEFVNENGKITEVNIELQEQCCINGAHFAYCVEDCKSPKQVVKIDQYNNVIIIKN